VQLALKDQRVTKEIRVILERKASKAFKVQREQMEQKATEATPAKRETPVLLPVLVKSLRPLMQMSVLPLSQLQLLVQIRPKYLILNLRT
jgi:hypothetical protein